MMPENCPVGFSARTVAVLMAGMTRRAGCGCLGHVGTPRFRLFCE